MSGAVWLGELSYAAARTLQEELVVKRQREEIGDTVLLLSHPPTITLGSRSSPADFPLGRAILEQRGISLIEVARGGGPTYHGPGQLVIYPVVKLAGRGVKQFVAAGLAKLAELAAQFGVRAEGALEPAGLWVSSPCAKLGAVGLKIERSVTNHGFSFNVDLPLDVYELFYPCSQRESAVTSLAQELGGEGPTIRTVAECAAELFDPRIGPDPRKNLKSTYPGG